jgi:hypothetical protein
MNPAGAPTVLGMSHKRMAADLGTSEVTVKIHGQEGSELFYGSISGAPLRDEMGKPLDLLLFTPERSIMLRARR